MTRQDARVAARSSPVDGLAMLHQRRRDRPTWKPFAAPFRLAGFLEVGADKYDDHQSDEITHVLFLRGNLVLRSPARLPLPPDH
jgi:hypothetical protein